MDRRRFLRAMIGSFVSLPLLAGAKESSDVETSEKFDGLAVRYITPDPPYVYDGTHRDSESIWLIHWGEEEGRVNSLVPIE